MNLYICNVVEIFHGYYKLQFSVIILEIYKFDYFLLTIGRCICDVCYLLIVVA